MEGALVQYTVEKTVSRNTPVITTNFSVAKVTLQYQMSVCLSE